MKSVLVVTGEASGDLHGANLVRAMADLNPSLVFAGMGGEEMVAAGVDILFDAARVSVVGLAEVISHLPDIWSAQRVLRRYLRERRPDLLIIIDLPDFNLLLARVAQKLGVKVFYYITPQVWAWRSSRVKTIRERVDIAGVILPFEEQFFKERGLNAHYVGHPLLDSVRTRLTEDEFRAQHGIAPNRRCIGLIPGSRKREVTSLMPIFLEAGRLLQKRCKEPLTFLVPLASTISQNDLDKACDVLGSLEELDIRLVRGERYELMAACDCVVAASGTVTLELALLDTPMVVTYRLAPLTYRLGRLLIKLDHFSLVNLIAGREVVPELLQDEVQPEAIATHLHRLLSHHGTRKEIAAGLARVRELLGDAGASERAARLALSIIDENAYAR